MPLCFTSRSFDDYRIGRAITYSDSLMDILGKNPRQGARQQGLALQWFPAGSFHHRAVPSSKHCARRLGWWFLDFIKTPRTEVIITTARLDETVTSWYSGAFWGDLSSHLGNV
jgi:hypothetical protein